jgi:hypothetical protein
MRHETSRLLEAALTIIIIRIHGEGKTKKRLKNAGFNDNTRFRARRILIQYNLMIGTIIMPELSEMIENALADEDNKKEENKQ